MKKNFKIKIILLTLVLSGVILLPFGNSVAHAANVGDLVPKTTTGDCPPGSSAPVAGANCAINNVQAYQNWFNTAGQQETQQQTGNTSLGDCDGKFLSSINPACFFSGVEKSLGETLITLGSLILSTVALLFDKIIDHTIVHMADGLNDPNGIGGGINTAWATLRDIANMAFIFVLLWAAIQTILNLETAKFSQTIKHIIIIALLINFSLFFSKLVIDAGNIATIGFYNSITAGSNGSLTQIFANLTNVQSYYNSSVVSALGAGNQAFMTGLLGLITMLILSVVLLVAGVMFLARYIILIFIMVLSPLAFIGYIIPSMSGRWKDWWKALIDQSFFAPYFMLLIWVAIKIMTSQNFVSASDIAGNANFGQIATSPISVTGLIMKFVLVIGFIIGAIILSKKMATSTAGFAAVAGGVISGAGIVGRNTIGRGARAVANSETLRNQADKGKNAFTRSFAKSTLWTANRGQGASFDLRTVPGGKKALSGLGDASGKGGFNKAVEDKAKAKAQYAKDVFGQTAGEKERLEAQKDKEKAGIKARRESLFNEMKREETTAESARKTDLDSKLRTHKDNYDAIKREKQTKDRELDAIKRSGNQIEIKRVQDELSAIATRMDNERKIMDESRKEIEENDAGYRRLKEIADQKKEAREKAEKQFKKKDIDDEEYSIDTQNLGKAGSERQKSYANRVQYSPIGLGKIIGGLQGNTEAARKIREQAKGKSNKDKLADAAAALAKEQADSEGGGTLPTPPPAATAGGGAPTP